MSDWDDLFASAAGVDESQDIVQPSNKRSIAEESIDASSSCSNSVKAKKKKRKLKEINKSRLDIFLDSRLAPIDEQIWKELPSFLDFGPSLCKNVCTQWNEPDDDSDCPESLGMKCTKCNLLPLYHALEVVDKECPVLEVFALVRNIRCCSSIMLDAKCKQQNDFARAASKYTKILARTEFYETLPQGESEILSEKIHSIVNSTRNLKHAFEKWDNSQNKQFQLDGVFDEIVQVIIDCDALYYRIYYLQNCGMLPLLLKEDEEQFIPHPTTYFGSKNLAFSNKSCLQQQLHQVRSNSNHLDDDKWNSFLKDLGLSRSDTTLTSLDPLSFLHRNRMAESAYIFWKSGWTNSDRAEREHMDVVSKCEESYLPQSDSEDAFYQYHTTLAPDVLQKWRDSCRDLLCNLYAYAALMPENLQDVISTLRENGITSVIEMGCGTGYLSKLFNKNGIQCHAFDISPTCNEDFNEYHGQSPSYCDVQKAGPMDLQKIGKSCGNIKDKALLLCYPPPLSNMATETLQEYIKCGGSCIIHIGEFKGLTGDEHFEKKLVKKFHILYRSPTLKWGNDCSEISIWKLFNKKRGEDKAIMIPCCRCKSKEATKRYRYLRSIVYCSKACCSMHWKDRQSASQIFMVPLLEEDSDSFDNPNIFQIL